MCGGGGCTGGGWSRNENGGPRVPGTDIGTPATALAPGQLFTLRRRHPQAIPATSNFVLDRYHIGPPLVAMGIIWPGGTPYFWPFVAFFFAWRGLAQGLTLTKSPSKKTKSADISEHFGCYLSVEGETHTPHSITPLKICSEQRVQNLGVTSAPMYGCAFICRGAPTLLVSASREDLESGTDIITGR